MKATFLTILISLCVSNMWSQPLLSAPINDAESHNGSIHQEVNYERSVNHAVIHGGVNKAKSHNGKIHLKVNYGKSVNQPNSHERLIEEAVYRVGLALEELSSVGLALQNLSREGLRLQRLFLLS